MNITVPKGFIQIGMEQFEELKSRVNWSRDGWCGGNRYWDISAKEYWGVETDDGNFYILPAYERR